MSECQPGNRPLQWIVQPPGTLYQYPTSHFFPLIQLRDAASIPTGTALLPLQPCLRPILRKILPKFGLCVWQSTPHLSAKPVYLDRSKR